jgi:molybdate transport system substrate-binding protein
MSLLRALALVVSAVLLAAAPAAPVNFTIPGVDETPDLHGDPATSQLTIFVAGNQFFVMPALLAAFERAHRQIRSVFYETLPPGIEAAQLRAGHLQIGNLIVSALPDVMMAGRRGLSALQKAGFTSAPAAYASNDLAIEVRAGNPKGIVTVNDLARANVRVAMPNPKWEGVAAQIALALRNAGGAALETAVMTTKLAAGTTVLTQIHHRQTPRWIESGRVDAGVVWASEARYVKTIGAQIATIAIPASQNVASDYMVATLVHAPHAAAAKAFAAFLTTPAASAIYRSYGFNPPLGRKRDHS